MPRKYVTVDGIATLVHHRGPTTLPGHPPDLSTGPPVLFVHGAGGNGNEFSAVLDALDGEVSPVAYDQPGHGRSGGLDSLGSIEAMAAHLRGVAAAVGAERPVLVAAGMGARVALEAASGDPGFAAGLVLAEGAAAHAPVSDEAIQRLRRVVGGKERRSFDTSGYAPDTPQEVYQRAFTEWVKTDPRATLGDLQAERSWDGRGRLATLGVPVLIVVGAHEGPVARQAAEALADELPDARVTIAAGAGGRVVVERPDELARHVADFVGALVS